MPSVDPNHCNIVETGGNLNIIVISDTTTCDAGQFVGAAMCEPCTGNNIAPANNQLSACTPCEGNMVANTGKTACECPSGQQVFGTPNMCETPITCQGNMVAKSDNSACECPSGMQVFATPNMCETPVTCTGDLTRDANNMCVCPTGMQLVSGQTDQCETPAVCLGNTIRNAANMCVCPAGMQVFGTPNMCETPVNCAGNLIRTAQNTCACQSGMQIFSNPNMCETPANCTGGTTRTAQNTCECPAARPETYNTQSGMVCGKAAAELQGEYSTADCTRALWTTETAADGAGNIRRTCQIPVAIVAGAPQISPAALSPLQTNIGDTPDACVLAQHNGFSGGALPNCESEDLFGAAGLPTMPAGFNLAADRLTLVAATGAAPREIYFNNVLISRGGGGGIGGSNLQDGAKIALGVIAVIGVASVLKSGGDLTAFHVTPNYRFSHGGGYSYGSRVDFREDEFSAFWGAHRADGGAWLYSGGMEYAEEFWHVQYAADISGRTAAMELSAGVKWPVGVWEWQNGVNAGWDAGEEFSAAWQSSLTADYFGWRIAPSANLFWRGGGDDMNFRVNLRREF